MTKRRFSPLIGSVLLCVIVAPDLSAQTIPYGTESWDPEKFGNHRIVLEVQDAADAVRAHMPWRRRDVEPDRKDVIIVESATGSRVNKVARLEIKQAYGDVIFQAPGKGLYYAYFMPYTLEGRNYPKVTYSAPEATADSFRMKTLRKGACCMSAQIWGLPSNE
jgi:hypothetical protein